MKLGNMKITLLIAAALVMVGCAQQPEIDHRTPGIKAKVRAASESHARCIMQHAEEMAFTDLAPSAIVDASLAACQMENSRFNYLYRAHLMSGTSGSAQANRLADQAVARTNAGREAIARENIVDLVDELRTELNRSQ